MMKKENVFRKLVLNPIANFLKIKFIERKNINRYLEKIPADQEVCFYEYIKTTDAKGRNKTYYPTCKRKTLTQLLVMFANRSKFTGINITRLGLLMPPGEEKLTKQEVDELEILLTETSYKFEICSYLLREFDPYVYFDFQTKKEKKSIELIITKNLFLICVVEASCSLKRNRKDHEPQDNKYLRVISFLLCDRDGTILKTNNEHRLLIQVAMNQTLRSKSPKRYTLRWKYGLKKWWLGVDFVEDSSGPFLISELPVNYREE